MLPPAPLGGFSLLFRIFLRSALIVLASSSPTRQSRSNRSTYRNRGNTQWLWWNWDQTQGLWEYWSDIPKLPFVLSSVRACALNPCRDYQHRRWPHNSHPLSFVHSCCFFPPQIIFLIWFKPAHCLLIKAALAIWKWEIKCTMKGFWISFLLVLLTVSTKWILLSASGLTKNQAVEEANIERVKTVLFFLSYPPIPLLFRMKLVPIS